MYMKNFGEFYNNQIESASAIVLSRTQNMKEDKLEESVALIKEHNSKAAVITTPWDELSGEQIVNAMKKTSLVDELLKEMEVCPVCGHHHHDEDDEEEHEHCCHHHHDEEEHECHGHGHHHHHHVDDVFNSWGTETPHKYDREELDGILRRLVETDEFGTVLRAKGMVPAKDGSWIYFDAVPGEYELRDGSPEYTGKLCVIGTDIDAHKMEELFGL